MPLKPSQQLTHCICMWKNKSKVRRRDKGIGTKQRPYNPTGGTHSSWLLQELPLDQIAMVLPFTNMSSMQGS